MSTTTAHLPKLTFVIILLVFSFFLSEAKAQRGPQHTRRAVNGEMATCLVKVNTSKVNSSAVNSTVKTTGNARARGTRQREPRQVEPNQTGLFDEVADIAPMEVVPIEIFYPMGKPGEEVVIQVLDGGVLDDGYQLKVMKLNNQKKLSFSFQVSDHPGTHRVMLRKDFDEKVVQLWVGQEHSPVKK